MTRLIELAPKKEGNCHVIAIWPRHMISLVIPSNDILPSPPIALIYCFVLIAHFSDTPNLIYLLLQIGFLHRIIKKPTSRDPICWEAH